MHVIPPLLSPSLSASLPLPISPFIAIPPSLHYCTTVNNVLHYLSYVCSTQYGCTGGVSDKLTITVDDEGYVGHGGPLTATTVVDITVTSHQ